MFSRSNRFGMILLQVFSLVLFAKAQDQAKQAAFLIAPRQVGLIALLDDADSVYARYRGKVLLADLQNEGHLSPALFIQPEGTSRKDAIVAELGCSPTGFIITAITVKDPAFHTRSGIGVGSTIGQLRARHKLTIYTREEGAYAIFVEGIQMSFGLDQSEFSFDWNQWNDPSELPDNLKIGTIRVY